MSRLLHLSDTHFGTELPAVLSALERLVACVRPEVLVLSGDITQRATAAQFASARDWLARLPVPHRLVIGGNHDIPLFDLAERLRHPYRRLSAAFGAEREPRLDLPDWQVLTLDTTRWWRHRDGTLSRTQIARTADALQAAAPGQIRVVVTHHPLQVTRSGDEVHRPTHHREALSAWAGAGADLLLSGHIHLPAVVPVAVDQRGWHRCRRPVTTPEEGGGSIPAPAFMPGIGRKRRKPGSIVRCRAGRDKCFGEAERRRSGDQRRSARCASCWRPGNEPGRAGFPRSGSRSRRRRARHHRRYPSMGRLHGGGHGRQWRGRVHAALSGLRAGLDP